MTDKIEGRNPVTEALKSGRTIDKIYVKKGDRVEYNQAIGEVGNSGRSTGSHLHYEILYRGVHVDPLPFVNLNNYNAS